jgi:hypothetical protein
LHHSTHSPIVPLISILLVLFAATFAHAQSTAWTGGGATNNWSDAGNWTAGAPQNGYDVYFTAVGGASDMDIPGLTLNRLNMSGFTGTLTLLDNLNMTLDCVLAGTVDATNQGLAVASDLIVPNGCTFYVDNSAITLGGSLEVGGAMSGNGATINVGLRFLGYPGGAVTLGGMGLMTVWEAVELQDLTTLDLQSFILRIDGIGGSLFVASGHSLGVIEIVLSSQTDWVDLVTFGGPVTIYNDLTVTSGILDISYADLVFYGTTTVSALGKIRSASASTRTYDFWSTLVINDGVFSITAPSSSVRFFATQFVDVNGTGFFHIDGGRGSNRVTLGDISNPWDLYSDPSSLVYIRDAEIAAGQAIPTVTVHSCVDLGGNIGFVFIEPDISLSDTTIAFGNLAVGATAYDTVFVRNIGTDSLVVSSITNSLPEYTPAPTSFVVLPGDSQLVEISFSPASLGTFIDSLEITSDDPDAEVVKVDLIGTALLPDLVAVSLMSPPSLDDGGAEIGLLLMLSNSSVADAGPFRASLRISEDAVIDTSDVILSWADWPGLPAGGGDGLGPAVTIPKAAPRGNVYIGGFVDDLDQVAETDENNNTISAPFSYQVPLIHSVIDVPSDQGGNVFLSWYGSPLDPLGGITEYTLWRTIDVPPAAAQGILTISSAAEWSSEFGDKIIRMQNTPAGPIFWEHIATHGAFRRDAYGMEIPSMFDSTGAGFQYQYFQVIAHTAYPDTFYLSAADSGYSVDNLAPAAPQGLAAEQSAPEALLLSWDANTEADLSHYAVYRGTDADFTPSEQNRVGEPTDPELEDGEWTWDSGFYYKITALDIHDNESPVAMIGPEVVVGAEQTGPPRVSYLAHSRPNPFGSDTRIDYGLAGAENVSIRVYDVAGRLVRTLVDGHRGPDHYSVVWDGRDNGGRAVAGGIYFCRIEAGAFVQTRKMTLLR